MAIDYDSVAETYARNRRKSDHVISELRAFCALDASSRVLEVGCGTANHIHALIESSGCSGWGVEPSREMRGHASVHDRLTVCQGTADVMPFENGFFDLAFSVNVIHHVPNPRSHFKEALRVLRPGGLLCTVTDSTDMIRRREPLSRYWPSSAEADMARYPTVSSLLSIMAEEGFTDLTSRDIRKTYLVTDARPYREKAFSCLRLITEVDFDAGLQRLEDDLRKNPVQGLSEYVCIWGKVPVGR